MKIKFKTVVISLIGIILLGLFILMTIYLVGRRVNQEYAVDQGPDPTEQFQLAEAYEAVTSSFIGEGECAEGECESVRISLSLTKENESEDGGEFVYSKVYLGAEKDLDIYDGDWSEEGERVILDHDDEIVTMFLKVDNTLVAEDGSITLTLLE